MVELPENKKALVVIGVALAVTVLAVVYLLTQPKVEEEVSVTYIGGAYLDDENNEEINIFEYISGSDGPERTPELTQATLNWIWKYENTIKEFMPEFKNDLLKKFPTDNEKIEESTYENFRDNITVQEFMWSKEGDILAACVWNKTITLQGYHVTIAAYVFMEPESLRLNKILVTKYIWFPLV